MAIVFKKDAEKKTQILTVKMTETLRDRISTASKAEDVTSSEFVRLVVEDYLNKQDKKKK